MGDFFTYLNYCICIIIKNRIEDTFTEFITPIKKLIYKIII